MPGDPAIAPMHAQIIIDQGGGVSIVDQNSPTGVFVNGVRVRQIALRSGMLIKIGGTELRFVVQ